MLGLKGRKKARRVVMPDEDRAALQQEAVYDQTPAPALKRRRRWKKYRWLLWLLLLAPLAYFGIQVALLMAPRMRFETVMLDSMTESITVVGQVVLNSQPISGGSGQMYYTVPTGQRVSANAQVALEFTDEQAVQAMQQIVAIDSELELLYEAQQTTAESGDLELLLSQMHGGLFSMLSVIDSGDYTQLGGYQSEAALAANKIRVSTRQEENFTARLGLLNALRLQYESIAVPVGEVFTPVTGYFVPSLKADRLQPAYEEISALAPAVLQARLTEAPRYYGADVVGHVVPDYRWYFFAVVSEAEAEKFSVGDKSIHISFPAAGGASLPVTVNSVTPDAENGIAAVELMCEYISPEVLQLRVEEAEIIFGEQKGIRISKEAIRMVDEVGEDGLVVTYTGVYEKIGGMLYFRRIEILLQDEFYVLVPDVTTRGVNEVELYDEIVVDSGGAQLHDQKIL